MINPGFSYMLRFSAPPDHLVDKRLDDMIRFCRQARIDDVMFFMNSEELNSGHLTLEESKPWLDVMAKAKRLLEQEGITMSINPWITMLHSARGRTLREGQHFRLMTDPYGNRSTAVVCPLCPEWRTYITDMYAAYAGLQPYALWVEDDFRFHNHDPLVWGGCFCDEHMRLFAEKAGVAKLERDAFLQGLLQVGEPHEYRHIWLDSCRDTIVELARDIGAAVHRVSPATRIGLMTSVPSVHAAEGRDWQGLVQAFDGERTMIVRTHLPAYTEVTGPHYWWIFNHASRHTAAIVPEHTEQYPELENYPFSLYIKSVSLQKFQLETSTLLGSRGITMDIFDVMGNGVYPEERYGPWLGRMKSYLDTLASFGLHVKDQTGVQVPVCETSSYTLHTSRGERMEELYPRETMWASYLSAIGVSNRYVAGIPAAGGITAISGQYLRNLSQADIRSLFAANPVLLEGEAIMTLCEMGLGSLCGIEKAEWHHYESGFASYEQIADGREYVGIAQGRMTAQIAIGNFLEITYSETPEVISRVYNGFGKEVCPGMTIAKGRVFVLPYGQFNPEWNQGLLSPIRRGVIQEAVRNLSAAVQPLMIASYSPHVAVYGFESGGTQTIAIVNASSDDAGSIRIAGTDLSAGGWTEFSRNCPDGAPADIAASGDGIVLQGVVPALSMTVLRRVGIE